MNVTLYYTPTNNHGCRGFDIEIEPIDERVGIVVSGSSCSSCWQVGHDDSSPIIPLGSKVCLPANFAGTWFDAEKEEGYSHNELVDDQDEPRPDCSVVSPCRLIHIFLKR